MRLWLRETIDNYTAGGSSGCECEAYGNDFNMVNTVNFNIYYFDSEQLSELVLIRIMVFPRILILVQNILIYLLEILNRILQGWRH